MTKLYNVPLDGQVVQLLSNYVILSYFFQSKPSDVSSRHSFALKLFIDQILSKSVSLWLDFDSGRGIIKYKFCLKSSQILFYL